MECVLEKIPEKVWARCRQAERLEDRVRKRGGNAIAHYLEDLWPVSKNKSRIELAFLSYDRKRDNTWYLIRHEVTVRIDELIEQKLNSEVNTNDTVGDAAS